MISKNSIFTMSEFVKTESLDATSHEAQNNSAKADRFEMYGSFKNVFNLHHRTQLPILNLP